MTRHRVKATFGLEVEAVVRKADSGAEALDEVRQRIKEVMAKLDPEPGRDEPRVKIESVTVTDKAVVVGNEDG